MFFLDRRTTWFGMGVFVLFISGCMELSSPEGRDIPAIRDSYRPVNASLIAETRRADTRRSNPAPAIDESVPSEVRKPEELPIDLPTVLRLAGGDALEVRLANERVAEARARTLAADMQFLPSIQPNFVNRWHSGRTQAVNGPFLDVDKQNSQLGVSAYGEWRIGESLFQSLAARKRAEAREEGLRAAKDDAVLGAANAFFNLVQARTDQAIVEDRLKQADETVRLNEDFQKAGKGLLSEVKRAQAARAEIKARLSAAKEKVRVASLNLTDVLHIDPLVTLVPQQGAQDLVTLVSPEKDIADLVSDAISRRPELAESRAFWKALDRERRAALIAPLIPTIRGESFDGGFGGHPSSLHRSEDYVIGLQWKVGSGGIGDVARIHIAEAQQRQEGIRFLKIADVVVRQVVENQTHVNTTREQIDFAKEEVAAAEESLRLSNDRLRGGSALTIEVLNAEDALFAAKSRAAQEVTEFNKAQYGLLRSIGGFRESDAIPKEAKAEVLDKDEAPREPVDAAPKP
jgi:outer membrane protein TolC